MNLVDDYFESIKPNLSEEEIILFDKLITILNRIDNDIMGEEEKIDYINKFSSYTGDAWEIESKRNFTLISLSTLESDTKSVGK